jgi:RsiW-degrading membrane proteinase PrsW (M82 family)
MSSALGRLRGHTIWATGAIPIEEWKYRNLMRVWLPFSDLIAVVAGINATLYGSRLLNRVLGEHLTDAVGLFFAGVALASFVGVAIPKLYKLEAVATLVLVGLVVAYMGAILFFPSEPSEPPNWFIVTMLGYGLPLACFRLNLIGEDVKERRAERAAAEAER